MRSLAILLIPLCAVASSGPSARAAPPPPPGLEVLWEFPYEYELLVAGLRSNGGYHTQDDFVLEDSGVVMGFECWFIYDGSHPQPFEGIIFYDDNGRPSGRKWLADITDVTDTYTGDDWSGFGVYHTLLLLEEEDYVFIEAGRPFWLELFWTGFYNGYWLCAGGGNAHCNGHEYYLSTFFTILGIRSEEAVVPASWGEIKAGF